MQRDEGFAPSLRGFPDRDSLKELSTRPADSNGIKIIIIRKVNNLWAIFLSDCAFFIHAEKENAVVIAMIVMA